MGLFSNPLGYAGYPPGVTAQAQVVNSTVRAATQTEVNAGVLKDVYVSPETLIYSTPSFDDISIENLTVTESLTLDDAVNVAVGTTTGSKIGTATTQKLGFFNATPIVQPVTTTDIKVALVNLGLLASGASPLDLGSAALGSGTHTLSDAANIVVGTTTGTIIGTATTQKLGFFNATPIVQPAANTDIFTTLVNLGLLATGTSPLNIGTGAITCGALTATGTAGINTSGAAVTTIGTGGTGAVNIGNATGNTAVTGSLTASTTLTATSGAITATNGNFVLGTLGNKIIVPTGTNASAGTSVAMTGTPGAVTVATTACSATAKVFYSRAVTGGTMGNVSITAQDGTGFTLTSDANETSTFNWWIINA